ncbi:MAG: MATE family efflux transporter [Eubacteriales bacterium]
MMKKGLLTNNDFLKNMLKLGVPIALQQLLYSVFSVVDTAMIAQLGADATAGVGLANRWFFFILLVNFGLVAGTMALVSQYWGIKDFKNIRRTTGISLIIGLSLTAIFTVFVFSMPRGMISVFADDAGMIEEGTRYLKVLGFGMMLFSFNFVFSTSLKSTETVRIPLVASVCSILVNVFLNWVFIFGHLGAPAMGVAGAALGTVISHATNTLFMVIAVKIKGHPLLRHMSDYFSITRTFLKKFLKVMTPALVNEVLWVLGTMAYSVVLGRYGSVNYGAYTIFNSVESMFFTFFIGLSGATSILVGKELGQGNIEKGWSYAVKALVFAPFLAAFLGGCLILLRYPVLELMQIPDRALIDMSAKLLLFYAIASPVRIIPYMTIVGIFRSGGDTISGLWIDSVNVWLVGVPVTLFVGFVLKAPFIWAFLAMYSEDVLKSVLCVIIFVRRKWLNQLTHDSEMLITEPSAVIE